jgi:hypothetical protein
LQHKVLIGKTVKDVMYPHIWTLALAHADNTQDKPLRGDSPPPDRPDTEGGQAVPDTS